MSVLNLNFEDIYNNYFLFLTEPRGNCNKNISTEAHFKSKKTSRGSYSDLETSLFVQIF